MTGPLMKASHTGPPSHLLVVEDDEGLRELFREQLASLGVAVECVPDGKSALEWLQPHPNCLILLDYALPDMTAQALIQAIASDGSSPPFIVITGHGDERIAVEMMKLGARDYVVKDTGLLDHLPRVVERVLRENEGHRRAIASERKFQAIFEGSSDALLLLDNNKVFDCNERAVALFGFTSKPEMLGLELADLSPPGQPDGRHSREAAAAQIARALEGSPGHFEWVHRRRDGGDFPAEVLLSPFELDGRVVAQASVRDITERKRVESVLREAESRHRHLFEDASEGIAMADAMTGIILDCNKAFLDLFGYDRSEVVGKPQSILHPPEPGRPQLTRTFALHRDEDPGTIVNVPIITKPGAVRLAEIKASILQIAGRKVLQGFFRDVTEEQRYERERETTLRLLNLLNEHSQTQDLVSSLASFLQTWTGCDAVGIRLREGDDFPYVEARGFTQGFAAMETTLCARGSDGELIRGQDGVPLLKCLCGHVILGLNRPNLPSFTVHGSFWTNSLSGFMASTPRENLPDHIQGCCLAGGYESVALIPLRHGGKTLGLLQLNDHAKGRLTAELIGFLENSADQIAIALTQRQTLAALRSSERRFREIVEDSLAGYFRLDRSGRFMSVNGAWLRMHGYTSPEEVVGQHFGVTQVEADLGEARSIVERLLSGEPVPEGEFTRRCKDGSLGYHTFSAHPVGEGDTITGIEGFLIDTTSLRRAEANYGMLFEKMLDGFALHEMIFDDAGRPADYRFLAVNPAFEQMTGLTAVNVVGHTVREVLPTTEPFWIETYGRVVLTGEPSLFEHFSSELGRHFQVSAFRPAAGQFAVLLVDVTGRKRAEVQSLYYQAQLQAIYDNAPLMMCLLNEQRHVERMNRAMADFAGLPLPNGAPKRPGDYLACLNALDDPEGCGAGPNCRACPLRLAILETLRTGLPKRGVEANMFVTRRQERREVRLSASTALVDVADETKLLVCIEDITARKQLEDQFLQAQKMEAVGHLAGGVAHDFNNILAAIIMQLHLLQETEGSRLGAATLGTLKEVQGYAQRAAELTRQLLLFSRRKAAQLIRLNAHLVLEGMMKMLGRLLGEHIEVRLEAPPEAQWVDADPGMLEQVIMNLCVNARDAMPNGGHLALSTSTVEFLPDGTPAHPDARPGRFVCLAVADTGCGMDDATLRRLFEPFFTTKEVGKGTGLGLATVYGIVRQHQGWVCVESAIGVGTTFRVFLPRTDAPEASLAEKRASSMPRGNERILLVEDEPDLLKLISRILRGCGYHVFEARNGIEALSVWEDTGGQIDLLLSDIVMPGGVGGLELVSRLRRSKPGIKALLSSGYSHELTQQATHSLARVRFLGKPYEPGALARAVRDALDESLPSA